MSYNKLKESKNKVNINLPPITPTSASPKSKTKNILLNNQKLNINKSYQRMNTYTPVLKNNLKSNNIEQENNNGNLKEILTKKIKNNRKVNYDTFKNNSLNLPKININNQNYKSPTQSLKQFNIQQTNNINNNYNNILNNIKNDFLLLDSIKNRSTTDRNNQNKNLSYQTNNKCI